MNKYYKKHLKLYKNTLEQISINKKFINTIPSINRRIKFIEQYYIKKKLTIIFDSEC